MGDIWMYGWMSRKWLRLDQWFDISELDDNSYVLTLYVGYIRIDGERIMQVVSRLHTGTSNFQDGYLETESI